LGAALCVDVGALLLCVSSARKDTVSHGSSLVTMVALVDDKAISREVFPLQSARIGSQKPENLRLGSNHISNAGAIAQVKSGHLGV